MKRKAKSHVQTSVLMPNILMAMVLPLPLVYSYAGETLMTRREQIKKEIDEISDDYLETLHRIIVALKSDSGITGQPEFKFKGFPIRS